MITLTCTSCKATLSIDDAFAGGVCRCQYCGTIQTVPASLKDGGVSSGAISAAAGEGGAAAKTLYQRKSRGETGSSGTGLDDLASVVASSGLSGSGLTGSGLTRSSLRRSPNSSSPVSTDSSSKLKPIILAAGGLILVLLLAVVYLAFRGSGEGESTRGEASSSSDGVAVTVPGRPAPRAAGAAFADIRLDVPSVIYVVDRGSGTASYFSAVREAVFASIRSLGVDRKFQILFWDNDGPKKAWPQIGTAVASADNIEQARKALEDVFAFGASDIAPALQQAMTSDPAAVVIITGKGADLDESFVKAALAARGSRKAKLHTVALGSLPSPALRDLATRTGGEYRLLSDSELRQLGE